MSRFSRASLPLVATLIVAAGLFVSTTYGSDGPSSQAGRPAPDRGTLPQPAQDVLPIEVPAAPAPPTPTGEPWSAFIWVPIQLPAIPGIDKGSLGGIIPPEVPAAAPNALEQAKLALARAAVAAARAPSVTGKAEEKAGTAVAPPLEPDPPACLITAPPPVQDVGPIGPTDAELTKRAQQAREGARP